MRIIFCGGGTVGHITPAIAIAEKISRKNEGAEILFIGREGGEENTAVTNHGFNLTTVDIKGFERKLSIRNLSNFKTALKALKKAKSILKSYSPDVVVGTGGYVTWPVVRAAQKLKIPTVIHESNACPGLTAKLLAPNCDKVLVNLSGTEAEFKHTKSIKTVGNPVREDFFTLDKAVSRKKLGISQNEFLISSFGGSGGSEKINETVIALMKSHSSKIKNIKHIHSCGNKYFNGIKEKYSEFVKGYNGCIIKPYIENMPEVITASDIVISRCGAMTIAEISAAQCAAILIPSPNVTNNHQYKNAKLLYDSGACIMIEEKHLNERELLDAVRGLENDFRKRNDMREKIKKFCVKSSSDLIISEIEALL